MAANSWVCRHIALCHTHIDVISSKANYSNHDAKLSMQFCLSHENRVSFLYSNTLKCLLLNILLLCSHAAWAVSHCGKICHLVLQFILRAMKDRAEEHNHANAWEMTKNMITCAVDEAISMGCFLDLNFFCRFSLDYIGQLFSLLILSRVFVPVASVNIL